MPHPSVAGRSATDLLTVARYIRQQAKLAAVTEDMPKDVRKAVDKGLRALRVFGRNDKDAVRAQSALSDLAAACEDYRHVGIWRSISDEDHAEWTERTERRVLRCMRRADKALAKL